MRKYPSGRKVPVILRSWEHVNTRLSQMATAVSVAGFILMTLFILVSVFLRYVLKAPWTWGEEACRYIMVYSVFLGIFLATREGAHVSVEALTLILHGWARWFLLLLAKTATLAGYVWLVLLSWQYTQRLLSNGQTSPALHLPMWAVVAVLFIGFLCCVSEAGAQLWHFVLTGPADSDSEKAKVQKQEGSEGT